MKFPLIIAHGEQALYFFAGLIALLGASLAVVISGIVVCLRKSEEGKKTGKRLISVGGFGLVAVVVCCLWMFA